MYICHTYRQVMIQSYVLMICTIRVWLALSFSFYHYIQCMELPVCYMCQRLLHVRTFDLHTLMHTNYMYMYIHVYSVRITQVLDIVTEIFNSGGCEELGVPVRDPVIPE